MKKLNFIPKRSKKDDSNSTLAGSVDECKDKIKLLSGLERLSEEERDQDNNESDITRNVCTTQASISHQMKSTELTETPKSGSDTISMTLSKVTHKSPRSTAATMSDLHRPEQEPVVTSSLNQSPSKVRTRHESLRSRTQSASDEHVASDGAQSTLHGNRRPANVNVQPTLLDYFYNEVRRGYFLANDEQRFTDKRQKVYVFLTIPKELEKFMWYGFFQCVDAFLFLFTLLPIRFLLAIWFLFSRSIKRTLNVCTATKRTFVAQPLLQPAEICDLLKGIILILGAVLMHHVDTSILYHVIRSQSVIKLYIFYNMLEVADKLISSFGQDILDTLYWAATESRGKKREHLGVIPHFLMAIGYVYLHTNLILLQATSLNVALNSKNKALLTVMLSNNVSHKVFWLPNICNNFLWFNLNAVCRTERNGF